MKKLCLLFIAMLFSLMSCLPSHKEVHAFVLHTEKGKYPFRSEKYLVFDMLYHEKIISFSVYACFLKNRFVSISIGQESNKPIESEISYQDLIAFVSAVMSYLHEKENISTVNQIYTNIECWREVSKEITQEFIKNKDVQKTVENSRLLRDLTMILKSNGFEIKDVSLDFVMVVDRPTIFCQETSVTANNAIYNRLCGQIFIDVEKSHD